MKVFENLTDSTPTVFADLRTQVHNFWDRGLLGLALDPGFPSNPWVYVLYSHDAAIGGTAPRWGSVGGTSDACPTPPGATDDGCVISGRLSRLQASGNTMVGSEQVLIEDWCQQYPSHSVGSLAFGPDGALYVSGGDGASFSVNFVDYGQDGSPLNPCGDPPVGVGGAQTPPTAQGGALRSQDVRTTSDPAGLDGTILRVDPATGAGLPGNPFYSSADANMRRIVAYGLRNPFRITIRPGTSEVWVGDVGWTDWEEINRLTSPADGTADNFGWPCYEGDGRQSGYDNANLTLCENLYTAGSTAVVAPYLRYHHNDLVYPTDVCPKGGSSVAGVSFAFSNGGNYPPAYRGALFFADYTRGCIWSVQAGPNGLPDLAKVRTFVAGAAQPVDVQIGPGGDLFYVDLGGTIRRIRYFSANQPPTAVINAQPTSGPAPLTVAFDGTGSTDPDGDPISYAWDLDGDGAFDDATSATTSTTYQAAGTYTPRLQVTDTSGATGIASVTISAGNTPPRPVIDSPLATTTWRVGDTISFSGHATDDQDGNLAESRLTWSLIMHHCPSSCHEHPMQTFTGTSSGSFVAPDHEYPAYLELRLTATDSGGLSNTASTKIYPQTIQLAFATDPSGLSLTVGSSSQATPFSRTVITGSIVSMSANSPQAFGGETYHLLAWSDGGAQTHTVRATQPATYTATFVPTFGVDDPPDPVVVRGSTFFLRDTLTSGTATTSFSFGQPNDYPVFGDWDGDGTNTVGVVHGNVWSLRNSNTAGPASVTFAYGRASDIPVVGDWDGDGDTTPGVVRGNTWYLRNSNTGGVADLTLGFGTRSDRVVTGDWDGDGDTTPGVVRGNTWYLRNSNTSGVADLSFGYGRATDRPVVGDWDGDGDTTPGVVRANTWYLRNSNTGGAGTVSFQYGRSCDVALSTTQALVRDRDGEVCLS